MPTCLSHHNFTQSCKLANPILHHLSFDETSHFCVFLMIIAAPLRSLTKLLASAAAAAAADTLATE
jgi:hypothetical protein